jgi:glycosyltransferase involved in cell wall biosynthesis
MISFIIPAHNEEQHLGETLRAIVASANAFGEPFEVIVVDDSSTDHTGEIARDAGATVVRVEHRQISATRNAGARVAQGDLLMFVDADTIISPDVVRSAREAIQNGAIGGGCAFRFDGDVPLWARLILPPGVLLARVIKFVGGCCLFSTREAFDASGAFSEDYFAAEELSFIRALKQRGRFVILRPLVVTSGRKLRQFSFWKLLGVAWNLVFHGAEKYRQREGLEIWYGDRQEDALDRVRTNPVR